MVDPMTINYNITALTSLSAVDNPGNVLNWWNQAIGGFGVFVLLAVIGLVLFLASRKYVTSDTEALSYAGFIVSFAGIMLFLITTDTGDKLIGWGYLVIIFLITSVSTYLNFINRKF